MSKSKNNGIDPQALIDRYGADTARLFTMFAAPPEDTLEWSDAGVQGAYRFLKRFWELGKRLHTEWLIGVPGVISPKPREPFDWTNANDRQLEIRRKIHQHLRKATDDMHRQQFNTVVSAGMQILHALNDALTGPGQAGDTPEDVVRLGPVRQQLLAEGMSILLRVLAPIVPHIAHGLWRDLGFGGDLLNAPWPVVDEAALKQSSIVIVVQVNGKKRAEITVLAAASQEEVRAAALLDETVQKHIAGKDVKKVIVVPGKLVNIVVTP
jgi:leucyl-tRNA synthetase